MSNKSTHCGIIKKKKIKDLADNQSFYLSLKGNCVYRLQSLDHKKRMAIYTSEKSKRTFKSGWGKEVYV